MYIWPSLQQEKDNIYAFVFKNYGVDVYISEDPSNSHFVGNSENFTIWTALSLKLPPPQIIIQISWKISCLFKKICTLKITKVYTHLLLSLILPII